jgi:hypothetical protein
MNMPDAVYSSVLDKATKHASGGNMQVNGGYSTTYDLEYLYCSGDITFTGTCRFPKLKGIFVEGNMNLHTSAEISGIPFGAAVYVGGTLQSEGTVLNSCSFYANHIIVWYPAGNPGNGRLNSNSVFYPRSSLTINGLPRYDSSQTIMPQFYIPASCGFNFQVQKESNLPGIFFLQGDRAAEGTPHFGSLNNATGLFVGDFGGMGHINTDVLEARLDFFLWDTDLKAFLRGSPTVTAMIDDSHPVIAGTAGTEIEPVDFDVVIENDTVARAFPDGYDHAEMLWNAPEGIEASCYIESDNQTLRFEIWGVPETPLGEPIDIRIPGGIMASGRPVDLDINRNHTDNGFDVWAIAPAMASDGSTTVHEPVFTATSGVHGAELHDVTGDTAD